MSKCNTATVLSNHATHNVLLQVRLAKRLVEQSFADKVFYANSGTEANEAALKFTRKHARLAGGAPSSSHRGIPTPVGQQLRSVPSHSISCLTAGQCRCELRIPCVHYRTDCPTWNAAGIDPYDPKAEAPHEVVSFTGSFHGRTMGSLALTYKDQYKTPFAPGLPGARMVKYLDLDAAASVIQKVTLQPFLNSIRPIRSCLYLGVLCIVDSCKYSLAIVVDSWGRWYQ